MAAPSMEMQVRSSQSQRRFLPAAAAVTGAAAPPPLLSLGCSARACVIDWTIPPLLAQPAATQSATERSQGAGLQPQATIQPRGTQPLPPGKSAAGLLMHQLADPPAPTCQLTASVWAGKLRSVPHRLPFHPHRRRLAPPLRPERRQVGAEGCPRRGAAPHKG